MNPLTDSRKNARASSDAIAEAMAKPMTEGDKREFVEAARSTKHRHLAMEGAKIARKIADQCREGFEWQRRQLELAEAAMRVTEDRAAFMESELGDLRA